VFFLGAALGLAGIFMDLSWLVVAGMVVLLVGVLLRALPEGDSDSRESEPSTPEPNTPEPSMPEPRTPEL
jgi:hypothetical protein